MACPTGASEISELDGRDFLYSEVRKAEGSVFAALGLFLLFARAGARPGVAFPAV